MADIRPGTTLGQYKILAQIGQGGMGAIYTAYQSTLDRVVVVKVLPANLSTQTDYQARFEREIRTTAALEHPNIVPVYDYGIHEGSPYVVMRYLDGGSLISEPPAESASRFSSLSKTAPSPTATPTPVQRPAPLEILRQIASALDYAHSREIVHRDIKPANILFDRRGNAYLSDFGIATLTSVSTFDTGEFATAGTPAYMSPEQWRGEPVTAAVDVYALGVIAYELLTGSLPFNADTPFALLQKVLSESLPKSAALTDAPYTVLSKATAKKIPERYATAGEFVAALADAMSGMASDTPQPLPSAQREQERQVLAPPAMPPRQSRPLPPMQSMPRTASKSGMSPLVLLIGVIVIGVVGAVILTLTTQPMAIGEANQPLVSILAAGLVGIGMLVAGGVFVSRRTSAGTRTKSSVLPAQPNKPVDAISTETKTLDDKTTVKLPPVVIPKSEEKPASTVIPSVESKPAPTVAEVLAPPPPEIPSITFSGLKVGDTFAQYRLDERLDKGERSRVYRAYDEKRGHEVALKIMNAYGESNTRVERFKREARLLGRLHHAHIVPFFDYGSAGEVNYIAMPLLTGRTLQARLDANNGRLLLAEIVDILKQVAAALDYIHQQQIVHRDLKPTNIMFDDQENVYLVDFGIAKILDSAEEGMKLTQTGMVLGTPVYVSPEMWMGETPLPASDQYTLAVIVYQMLTGAPPFKGDTPYALMLQHVRQDPPKLQSIRPDLPVELDTVLQKALHKDPMQRYPSVRSFANALEQIVMSPTADADKTKHGHVFISYSRADGDFAFALAEHIRKNGFEVWIDSRIEPSDSWWHTIVQAIDGCAAFVAVMTPAAEESRWVHREVLLADQRNKPAFPVLLKGNAFPIYVATQYIDLTTEQMPQEAFYTRLAQVVTRKL